MPAPSLLVWAREARARRAAAARATRQTSIHSAGDEKNHSACYALPCCALPRPRGPSWLPIVVGQLEAACLAHSRGVCACVPWQDAKSKKAGGGKDGDKAAKRKRPEGNEDEQGTA